jgi:hypothetical protein
LTLSVLLAAALEITWTSAYPLGFGWGMLFLTAAFLFFAFITATWDDPRYLQNND